MAHITDVLCACGCGTHLMSPSVDRGWQFFRGHKAGTVNGKLANKQPTTRPGKVQHVTMDSVRQFLEASDKAVVDQIADCTNQIVDLRQEISEVQRKIEKLQDERKKYQAALLALGRPVTQ